MSRRIKLDEHPEWAPRTRHGRPTPGEARIADVHLGTRDTPFLSKPKIQSFHQPDARLRAASELIAHAVFGWLLVK